MRSRSARRRRRSLALLALAVLALVNGGCLAVAAGAVAAGGVAGYAYYKGSVAREYTASFEQTWAAAQAALGDLGMPVEGVDREDGRGKVTSSTGDGARVDVVVQSSSASPTDGTPRTRVSARMGVFGDNALSERYLDQVQARLNMPGGVAPIPVTSQPGAASCQARQAALPAETAPPPLAESARK